MNCVVCGKGVEDGPLHRTSPLGTVPANWKHTQCGGIVDPEVADIVNIIDEDRRKEETPLADQQEG